MTRYREERGQVIVLAAVIIPVFLLLAALVIDVGNWYTHKRQLQNRADAAAFAAGVEYAKNWRTCVQTEDTSLKTSAAQKIADAARQYAGDPEAADYNKPATIPTGLPPSSIYNTQIANQSKLDVAINSTSYDDNTDYSDDGDGNVLTTDGNPCFLHPADSISDAGYWTDVKVKERDLPSLFGGIGLPLSRNGARARIEIRPATSGTRFLPLAVPDNVITRVQVRYYDECHNTLLAKRDLAPLGDQGAYAGTGGTLWGLPSASDASVGDPSLSFALVLPPYDPACGDYLAVGTEVRIASTDDVDIDSPTCDDLRNNSRYADCFHRLSQIRIWNDGNADSQPRVPEVSLTGGCGSPGDAYFSALPPASNSCKYDVTVKVNWGTRSENSTNVPANFKVTANGTTNVPVSDWVSGGVSTYETTGGAITATPGANPVTISLNWTDTDKNHSWNGPCSNQKDNPCKYSGTDGHQAFVGTTATAGAVNLVRTSETATVNGVPGSAFANHRSGGAGFDCNDTDTCSIFPTIGTGSVLKTGVLTTLRLDDPQANQSVFCDPDETQAYPVFRVGCKPWFAKNSWASPWWIDGSGGDKTCPDPGKWYSYADKGFGFGVNSANNPWECVLTAPGVKTGQVGDDIAIATKNCNDDKNNSCQVNSFACNYDGNYDGKPLSPNGWTGDSRYPRVVGLFIVPYQSAKGLTGNGDPIPVLGFASFYVMNWTGSSKKQSDPCPDPDWDNDGNPATPQVPVPDPPPGAITGVFVEAVDYQPGPVDPHATCVEGQLGQCRAVLVR